MHYDAAMMKSKTGRIPMIIKKLDISDPAEERLSFLVQLTAHLDKLIFEDKTVQANDIVIGGEGDYRIKVENAADVDRIVNELMLTPGK